MWYRYAEQGSGLVLRFKSAPGVDSPWSTARRINYFTDMPLLLDNSYLADMLSGRASMDAQATLHHMVYSKSLAWAYEAEWRIFSGQGRDPAAKFEDIHFNAQELDAVIFGHRMPDMDRNAIAEITRRQHPHAKLLQLRKTALIFFELQIVPFSEGITQVSTLPPADCHILSWVDTMTLRLNGSTWLTALGCLPRIQLRMSGWETTAQRQ
jgi:hypothetical protein